MTVCTGRGGLNGDHCCYMDGEVCEFLEYDAGSIDTNMPRCSIWDRMDSDEYRQSKAGKWMERYGVDENLIALFTCQDWPQNIPNLPATTSLCCWEGVD